MWIKWTRIYFSNKMGLTSICTIYKIIHVEEIWLEWLTYFLPYVIQTIFGIELSTTGDLI